RATRFMERDERKRGSSSIPSIAIATEPLADAIHRAALTLARRIARDERQLTRTGADRIAAATVSGIDPGALDALLGRHQRLCGQAPEQIDPDLERAGRSIQGGGTIVVAANPNHAKPIAAEAGEPGIALAVAGAGLAGHMQAAQAGCADRTRRA